MNCNHRFTTYEELEHNDLRVVKRNGARQVFDRAKLLSGLEKACEKRPVSIEVLEQAADDIITDLQNSNLREIPTSAIGPHVMERLKGIDPVAYVRYASVYRQFKDIGEFIEEIDSLKKLAHAPPKHQPELELNSP